MCGLATQGARLHDEGERLLVLQVRFESTSFSHHYLARKRRGFLGWVAGRQLWPRILVPQRRYQAVLDRAVTRHLLTRRRQLLLAWHRLHLHGRAGCSGPNIRGNGIDTPPPAWAIHHPGNRLLAGLVQALTDRLHALRWKLIATWVLQRDISSWKHRLLNAVRVALRDREVHFTRNVRGPAYPLYTDGEDLPSGWIFPVVPEELVRPPTEHIVYIRYLVQQHSPIYRRLLQDQASRRWTAKFLTRLSPLASVTNELAWSVLPPQILSRNALDKFVTHRVELRRRAPNEDYGDQELALLRAEPGLERMPHWWPSGRALDERQTAHDDETVIRGFRCFRTSRAQQWLEGQTR